jgi:asparagine synthase (glutamine-hydrolysing)
MATVSISRRGWGSGRRRLAILDLVTGDQPLFNEDRTVGVVYNGEIFNFQSLVTELNGPGHQSAETLFVGVEL